MAQLFVPGILVGYFPPQSLIIEWLRQSESGHAESQIIEDKEGGSF